jgi:MFS family permease
MRLRIAVLALGTFAIGTDGFVIAGILPGVASDTQATVAAIGLLVTAFAIAYAIAAPLLATAVARIERRRVLVTGMAILAAANLAAAIAPGYPALMAARVAAALGAALYSPIAMMDLHLRRRARGHVWAGGPPPAAARPGRTSQSALHPAESAAPPGGRGQSRRDVHLDHRSLRHLYLSSRRS